MPAEMLAANCVNSTGVGRSSSGGGGGGGAGGAGTTAAAAAAAAARKDRSCKGKRYLEMISESKAGGGSSGCKRPKSHSVSSGASSGETTSESSSPHKSSTGNSSKWVSGGFDLEERIAALPQLQDTHLVNALNNNRTRNTLNGKPLGDSSNGADGRQGSSEGGGGSSGSGSSSSDEAALACSPPASPSTRVATPNGGEACKSGSDPVNYVNKEAAASPASTSSTLCSEDEEPPVLRVVETSRADEESAGEAAALLSPREFLASNFTLRSQGLEVGACDGLAALAEVALSQAQAITTSSSS